ncbi:hypothetical protein FHX09_000578 [Rhizobium sp. BK538]|nr:hypothetical protein [Rhizobium sp. BK538]
MPDRSPAAWEDVFGNCRQMSADPSIDERQLVFILEQADCVVGDVPAIDLNSDRLSTGAAKMR